ncbi:YqhR family membrane protein [Alkalihalobacterium elongatum]|uniref:YqhR family membrane protein n=1 Tax=Alkalihalobacterium elongatum TaxID=2675466 RepID=UPI001C1FB958|nr:YqhR family membrane protein [Alkalihalobacterium elongatum]
MENQQSLEQNKKDAPMSYNAKVATIGVCGGLFWSVIGYIAFFFNFARIGPALVLMPWALGDWKNGYMGQLVGILVISLLSILVAFIYKILFEKVNNMWAGAVYGIVLWLIVFYLLNPIFPGLKSVANLDFNTIITTLCLYLLYGVFIGYSISFEYQEVKRVQS